MDACLIKQKKTRHAGSTPPPTDGSSPPPPDALTHTLCKKEVRETHALMHMLPAVGMVVLFVIVMIICFYALEFQRRVMELLVAIRDGLADLKLDKERETSGSNPLPAQVTTLEELNSLDETLTDASVRQQLVGFATVTQQFQDCSIFLTVISHALVYSV